MAFRGFGGRAAALFLGMLTAAVPLSGASVIPAAQADLTLPIVFESNRSGRYQLYTMNIDGGSIAPLASTTLDAVEGSGSPDWSPDGARVAYSSRRGGDWDLFVFDGSAERNLTNTIGEDDKADWSPDGTRIAFTSRRGDLRWADVFIMDIDGGRVRNLTDDGDDDRDPAWSPSGTEIVYRSFRDGNYDLYALEVESGAPRRLTATDPPIWNAMPAWSPDGAWIAFETNRDGDYEIYLMDNNGANLRNLTRSVAEDKEPAWSPDGTQMLFTSNRDGNYEIYLLELASGAITRLTYDCGRDHNADWRRGAADMPLTGVTTAVAYTTGGANLRAAPDATAETVGTVAANDCLTVVGRGGAGQWLQVRSAQGRVAWIAAALVDIQGNLDVVPVSA